MTITDPPVGAEPAAAVAPGDADSPVDRPAPEAPARLCARVSCGAVAAATLTADYPDRVMAVGPLSPARTPPALDLCARHRDLLSAPDGWQLIRHTPER